MKLIVAIVQNQDAGNLMRRLAESRFQFTKIASTGGFLREGNTTLLVGAEDQTVEEICGIIKETCHSRERYINVPAIESIFTEGQSLQPINIVVGGAVIFILHIERFITI
ncbi:MAG: cyclic-di-AMP receptor [bacterium]